MKETIGREAANRRKKLNNAKPESTFSLASSLCLVLCLSLSETHTYPNVPGAIRGCGLGERINQYR